MAVHGHMSWHSLVFGTCVKHMAQVQVASWLQSKDQYAEESASDLGWHNVLPSISWLLPPCCS